jgi:hypothetical protein
MLIPVVIQLALNAHFNGYFRISNIGEKTIRGYFLSRLDVAIGQSPNVDAARIKLVNLSSLDAARLVLNHFGYAVAVFVSTLFENLVAGSNFVIHGHATNARVVAATNLTYFVLLLASIPVVGVALWRARDGRLALPALRC